ncbi:MAG: single-stranded DNA-binding protein, partial [Staphylococcus epidermidis]|nr:single-stranded DNA-binding protein [Staphylococcus epidermidis]
IANRIEFLDSKGSNQQNSQSQQQRGQAPAGNNPVSNGTDIDNSELPF